MYKLDCRKQFSEFLERDGIEPVSYIGYCFDEIGRYQKRKNKNEIYPLVDAGICEDEILEWAKSNPLFNDFYKYNRRCGCMYCPMQSMTTSAYLAKYYPEQYEEMVKMALETEINFENRTGKKTSVWCGNPKYNTEYREERVKEIWIPRLNTMG